MVILTHFVECNGRNSMLGFTLSPSYASLFLCPQSVHLRIGCTCRYQYLIFRHFLGIRIMLHGHAEHTGGNLKELLVLIPYINLAMERARGQSIPE